MTAQEYLDAIVQSNVAIGITQKLYLYDKNGMRVDFSDSFDIVLGNRLIEFDVVETIVEKDFNHFYNRTGTIKLRNDDRFFNKPFPPTLKTIFGTQAQFVEGSYGLINVFRKLGSVAGGYNPQEPVDANPAVFIINGVASSGEWT